MNNANTSILNAITSILEKGNDFNLSSKAAKKLIAERILLFLNNNFKILPKEK